MVLNATHAVTHHNQSEFEMGHWESARIPDDFDGVVRLFPLPNLVLFPHVIQALHIFEPRYCEMLSDSLESDHFITMALLIPGWESHIDRKPKIGQHVCIGRIISHSPTDDGRHNILLAGISRAKLVEELDMDTPFRQAIVELIDDVVPADSVHHLDEYRDHLLAVFRTMIPQDAANSKTFGDLLTQQLPLGILTDIIAYAVNIPIDVKHKLLGEPNVIARYELLMQNLTEVMDDSMSETDDTPTHTEPNRTGQFPPPFSDN
ncbi:LON peptidase substrate-binding domain-containing protein [Pirellulaceae bacterium SH449]